jgi:hypothetical protein
MQLSLFATCPLPLPPGCWCRPSRCGRGVVVFVPLAAVSAPVGVGAVLRSAGCVVLAVRPVVLPRPGRCVAALVSAPVGAGLLFLPRPPRGGSQQWGCCLPW